MDNFVLPASVKTMLAQRPRRLHHFIWHSVRNSWHDFPVNVQQELKNKGWEPPRPAFDVNGDLDLNNNSGEDFLFMHREMIAHTNAALQVAGDPSYPQVQGWSSVPPPTDPDFPVPQAYTIVQEGVLVVDTNDIKSDTFFFQQPGPDGSGGGMQHWDQLLSDPQVLESLSLGRLGSYVEFTIHNWMHMRWSRDPGEIRPDVRPDDADTINTIWDNPSYDWLGDTYSSHTDNHFWKLHGLIDRRIDEWAAANNVQSINWIGNWVGKMPPMPEPVAHVTGRSSRQNVFAALEALSEGPVRAGVAAHGHDHGHHHVEEMEAIVKLIQDCGVHYHFYDDHASRIRPEQLLR